MKFFLFFLIASMGMFSCDNKTREDIWYTSTKKRIETDSEKLADSASNKKSGNVVLWTYFCKGKKIKTELANEKNGMEGVTLFDSTQQFELRQEICDDELIFEGITYKGKFYGLSRWWNCAGQLIEGGVRYGDKKIGKWEYWDENGKLTIEQQGEERLLDSLVVIR